MPKKPTRSKHCHYCGGFLLTKVNHYKCAKCGTRFSTMKKEDQCKNPEIEKIVGRRKPGIMSFQFPFEMDYFCPVCHSEITDVIKVYFKNERFVNETTLLNLHFSEYNYFMWCNICNIDIPSFLCLRATTIKSVKVYTERYLEMFTHFKKMITSIKSSKKSGKPKMQKKTSTDLMHLLKKNISKEKEEVKKVIEDMEIIEDMEKRDVIQDKKN